MKTLITGASGLLGKRLFDTLSKTEEVAGTYHSNRQHDNLHFLDISDRGSVDSFFDRLAPEVVIHTAAMVDVDYCEENKEAARRINVEGTANILRACKARGCKLVYVSSDYVFDGDSGPYREDSPTRPVNHYGQTKLEGERMVREGIEDHLVIRPAILYGNDDHCKETFISRIVRDLRSNKPVILDDKVVKYPTLTDDVVEAIRHLVSIDARGVFHVSGGEPVTRYDWALKIVQVYGLPTGNISRGGSPGKARRPLDIQLDSSKIQEQGFSFAADNVEKGTRIMRNQKGCAFRMMYSVRPDMMVLNQSVSAFRVSVGKQLAREHPAVADITIPIPESGIFGATGYADESKIPFYFGLIRDYFTNKTLFEPTLQMRAQSLDKKLIAVPDVVRDRRLVVVDEAIAAGTTLYVAIDKLKKAGAKEIHIRIPSPPMVTSCSNGILRADAELIAQRFGDTKGEIEEGLRKHFKVDSLHFLSPEGLMSSLASRCDVCVDCFRRKNGR